ncbi:hypothetical protein JCM11491_005843 [Sporobolomyces phaffii]
MSSSATPSPAFDSAAATFQAELEAVHRGGPGQVYKAASGPGGAWASGGGWAQAKPASGSMADGKDFVQTLAASLAKSKPPPATPINK